jgi:hyperosmotically inducible protein
VKRKLRNQLQVHDFSKVEAAAKELKICWTRTVRLTTITPRVSSKFPVETRQPKGEITVTSHRRSWPRFLLTWLFLAVVLPPALAHAQDNRKSPQQRQAEAQARLEKEVRHELVMLPFYSVFDNLEYRVDGDRVTLSGQVTQPTLKSDAEKSVKSIEGVSAVDNKMEVLPVSPNDDRLRRAEFRAIYSAPNLNKYAIQAVPPIHIIVKGGHVTLVGVVANEADKNVAEIQAKSVSGVFSVDNKLTAEK